MKKKIWKRIIFIPVILLILAAAVCAVFMITRASGKSSLFGCKKTVPQMQTVRGSASAEQDGTEDHIPPEIPDEGTVRYKGAAYRYNSGIITLLLLGIDTGGNIADSYAAGSGGQADTVILAAVDTKNKTISFISVSRETMTEIEVYSVFGDAVTTDTAQLALQYAYGTTPQKSCELTAAAVSRLFYSLPIHGCFALNVSAIPILNDLVGGVTLTLSDDFSARDAAMVKGARLTLDGKQAEMYLRGRMSLADDTNAARMDRQIQYMRAFIDAASRQFKKDPALPLIVYNAVKSRSVTDLSVSEITWLAAETAAYSFSESNFHTVAGASKAGPEFTEFHADEQALYELILHVFYEKL